LSPVDQHLHGVSRPSGRTAFDPQASRPRLKGVRCPDAAQAARVTALDQLIDAFADLVVKAVGKLVESMDSSCGAGAPVLRCGHVVLAFGDRWTVGEVFPRIGGARH
jgi:hypothetical protein